MPNRAPPASLQHLHRLLTTALWRWLRKPKCPPVLVLTTTRAFLSDNRIEPGDAASHKALLRIQKLYQERLIEVLSQPNPPLTALTEARLYTEANRFAGGTSSDSQPVAPLDGPEMGLPFTIE